MIRSMGQRTLSYGLVIALCALTTASFSVSAEATSSSATSSASQKSAKAIDQTKSLCTPEPDPEPAPDADPNQPRVDNDCFLVYNDEPYQQLFVIDNDMISWGEYCNLGTIPASYGKVSLLKDSPLVLKNSKPGVTGKVNVTYEICSEGESLDSAVVTLYFVYHKKAKVTKLNNRRFSVYNPNHMAMKFQYYTEQKGYFNRLLAPGATKVWYAPSKVVTWRAHDDLGLYPVGRGTLRYRR